MEREVHSIEQLKNQGMLPLYYHADKEVCLNVAKALYDAGARIFEFTNRGENAMANFKELVAAKNAGMKGLQLGVGTIRTGDQATRFIEAGADFLVSPVFDPGVCDVAYMNKILWIPGCMTPTEIHIAENAGCKLIKLFPGNMLGPEFINAIKELFPKMLFMPTGGVEVDKDNLEGWFNSGACAVGMGSKLISKKDMEKKNYEKIAGLTKKALKIIQSIRK